ncbi:MAG: hypothetical protein KC560_12340, partial [Myxococcales bacterium]|nr:hypothetical protein [Myxococcales bacterium]
MRRLLAWVAGSALALVAAIAIAAALLVASGTCGESDRGPGTIAGPPRPVPPRAPAADGAAPAERLVLFGDLHVHTTFSIDAFLQGLPLFGGEGAHPPADACDFARHCAQLDFFSLNDHAESLWPERWKESVETVRQCNARAGDASDPDLVVYAGYEWTQVGATPETHFGHKNVIFRGTGDDEVARRPIDALPDDVNARARGLDVVETLAGIDALGMYSDFFFTIDRLARKRTCEAGVDTRALPDDCRENATTPRALFEKLAQSGLETLVIPHGLAWGEHAPVGARLDAQLLDGQHDPARQR